MKTMWYKERWSAIKPLEGETEYFSFRYKHWSTLVRPEAKESGWRVIGEGILPWLCKNIVYREVAILEPLGDPKTNFVMGFYDEMERVCMIAPMMQGVRRVADGPFAMRSGRKPISFFIIGVDKIDLRLVEVVNRDSAAAGRGGIYGSIMVY